MRSKQPSSELEADELFKAGVFLSMLILLLWLIARGTLKLLGYPV